MSQENQKVPSQVFRWFEKMKSNYEQSVQGVLQRFEQYSHSQQLRIDHANQSNIENLKQSQQKLLSLQNDQINQLNDDVKYYKEQMTKQQQMIEQLNGRYDAVMSCLLTEKRKDINIRDIFSDDDFVKSEPSEFIESIANTDVSTTTADTSTEPDTSTEHVTADASTEHATADTTSDENTEHVTADTSTEHATADTSIEHATAETSTEHLTADTSTEHVNIDDKNSNIHDDETAPLGQGNDELFEQALLKREQGEIEQAFRLFEQAAQLGHAKSMGAMGRSFFLGEGIEEDHSIGLAWLIQAANQALPQAIARVKHFQENEPELYEEALTLSEHLYVA
ncbi:MAG: hypothetical protein HRT54_16745 [Colwellia sp.]|nr:hypothetical protein [Colwellia sp.]